MKYLTIILICLMSVSCMTTKRIKKHCSEFELICVTDKEKEIEIRYIDTIIYRYRDTSYNVPVPPKIIYREKPVYIVKGIVNSDPLVMETDLCKSISQVLNSKLTNELEQKDTTIRLELKNALVEVHKWKNKYTKEISKEVITIQKNKPFAKFAIKWFMGSLIVIVIFIIIAFLKYKSKILRLIK